MAAYRAPKGGTVGKNGEFYEGGKFLPSTTKPKRSPIKRTRGPKKVEIEPYVWVESREGLKPLKIEITHFLDWNHYCQTKEARRNSFQPNESFITHYGYDAARIDRMIAAFGAGHRWYNPTTGETE